MEHLKIQPNQTILVLNSSYEPINFTNWKRAVILVLKDKVQVLSGRVVRLLNYIRIPVRNIMNNRPTRSQIYKEIKILVNIVEQQPNSLLTMYSKKQGWKDTWENLVVACSSCNVKKSDKLLEQTKLKLRKQPRAPYTVAIDRI